MSKYPDVVVVGGGIIGCSTALTLAQLGASVTVFERREIAHGASGRNHGLIFYPQNPLSDPLYQASHEAYREIASASPLDIGMDSKPRGFIVIVAAEEQWEAAEKEARSCEAGGVRIERMDAASLAEAEPNLTTAMLGGWFIEDGYRLDPAALTLAIALKARDAGAEIKTNADVKQIVVENGRVIGVATDEGFVWSKVVVDAAGPWAPQLARTVGVDLAITGARGWLLLTRQLPSITDHLIESAGWHLSAGDPGPADITVDGYAKGAHPEDPDVGLLIQQNANGHVLLGGSRLASTGEDAEGQQVTRKIAEHSVRAMPCLAEVPIIAVWSGVRPMSRDGLPLIGWVPGVEGLFVNGGHGGQGVMLGAGSGLLAAQMITGHACFTAQSPFDPGR